MITQIAQNSLYDMHRAKISSNAQRDNFYLPAVIIRSFVYLFLATLSNISTNPLDLANNCTPERRGSEAEKFKLSVWLSP